MVMIRQQFWRGNAGKCLIVAPRQSTLTLSDNQSGSKKPLRTSVIDTIMPALPAAVSRLDCRHSHPDCRATRRATLMGL
jgi:hypothetical protein